MSLTTVKYTEPATGTDVVFDDCGASGKVQLSKIDVGALGTVAVVTAANPFPIAIATGSNVIGALTANQTVDVARWNGVAPTAAAALSDTLANPTAPSTGACHMDWDGTQWKRVSGAIKGTALSLSARTAQATATLVKPRCFYKGLYIFIRVTVAGTSTMTFFIQGVDPVASIAGTMWNGANITAGTTGTFHGIIYPAIAAAPAGTALAIPGTIGIAPPEDIIIGVSKGDTSSWTYSLGYCWLP